MRSQEELSRVPRRAEPRKVREGLKTGNCGHAMSPIEVSVPHQPTRMKTPLILSSLIVVAASFDLSAAIVTWDGGSTQGPQWSSGPNWVGDTAPSPTDATADLRFAGSTRLDAQADQAWIM